MEFIKIKTRAVLPPKDDVYNIIDEYVPSLKEGDVLLITSKILAIHQGRCIKITDEVDKDELIIREADKYIPREECPDSLAILSIKHKTLLPSAGIDASNADGYYILLPAKINELARELGEYLKKKYKLKKLAIIVTDSHCVPLRYGVMGISIGFYGLNPLKDYRGAEDIFKRKLEMSQVNVVDALSAMGTLLMGEGSEKIPMLIIRGADFVEFTDEDKYEDFVIPQEEDIYEPLLRSFKES